MGEAFLYGNSWSESSGKIVTVHVFYRSSVNVTCTNGKKTYTGTTDANYNATFKLSKGIWTITAEKDGYTSSINMNVSEDCTVNMSIFSATINITYTAGSPCTITDGRTTLTSPDTSGTWACVVPNDGTWTITSILMTETITISGQQTVNIDITRLYLYKDGVFNTELIGGFSKSGAKYDSSVNGYVNAMYFYDTYILCNVGTELGGSIIANKLIFIKSGRTINIEYLPQVSTNRPIWLWANVDGMPSSYIKSATVIGRIPKTTAVPQIYSIPITSDKNYLVGVTGQSSSGNDMTKIYKIWIS